MCVIDDEGFEKESLLNLKFGEIYVMDEFRNMNDFEHYNVILCDIKGVGSELDNQLEGIALAREIKKLYPDKIVIQYSGQAVHDLYVKSLEKNRNYLDINKNDANLKIIKSISMGLFNLGLNVLNLYLESKK